MPNSAPGFALKPRFHHALPTAPMFAGRQIEMDALARFWAMPSGVLSLIGPGGAGKTTVAQRFTAWLLERDAPDGLFVWSFYEEPDPNAFLKAAYNYFARGQTADAHGAGWFPLLKDALADGGRYLLILDGLERVQRPRTTVQGIFGEMEDPLLRGLLTRLAAGTGRTKAIITSRFPVSDIDRWRDQGYVSVEVAELGRDAAQTLLRAHGVRGTEPELDRLLTEYGRHALTLDLLGGAATLFYGSEAHRVPNARAREGLGSDEQYRRLAAVLALYEAQLSARELALLSRLCVFRFGVDTDAVQSIFLGDGKESIAGALHGATREELDALLEKLVACHLILLDGGHRFTLHPAVRDHFYGLFREHSAVHEAVSQHLHTLTRRPGVGLPSDKDTLDLLEELIHHLLQAGAVDEAVEIYYHRLGGDEHLNATLGEYARCHRILSSFPECPDGSGMYHSLRAFGQFREALRWRPQNRYILLVDGALSDLCRDPTETTRRFAEFLRGEATVVPARSPDVPIPAAMLHLLRGDLMEAGRVAEEERAVSLFADDRVRQELALAEVARRERRLTDSQRLLDAASAWALQSGSQEHLCLMHIVRSRLAADTGHASVAASALDEGLHIADECGFVLWRVDLLIDQARRLAAEGRWEQAEKLAREARELSCPPGCRYVWGIAHSAFLLAQALIALTRTQEARDLLTEALSLMRHLADPAATDVERALKALV